MDVVAANPTRVARAALTLEALDSRRSPEQGVKMTAPRASERVAPDEPVRSGLGRGEAIQCALDEGVPCPEAAARRALLEVSAR